MNNYKQKLQEAVNLNYQIGICAKILNEESKILLISRSQNDNYGGVWELPGGGVEENEDIIDALIREIKEETGLDVIRDTINFIDYFEFHNIESNKHKRKFCFEVKTTGELTISDEHTDFRWFDRNEIINELRNDKDFPDDYNVWENHYSLLLK